MKNFVSRFNKDESGATAIEYGLIAGALAIVIVGIMATFGPSITGVFTTIGTSLADPY